MHASCALAPNAPSTTAPSAAALCAKTAVCHTITYVFMGVIAMTALHYEQEFARPEMSGWMRQLNDPLVMAGPLFQPIRGVIFALALYPFREILFARKRGWLLIFWLLFALGILSTFGPAPGSVEGMIYTRIPIAGQLRGWLEVVPQALLLSALLYLWVTRPRRWLNWTLGLIFAVVMALPILGLLAPRH